MKINANTFIRNKSIRVHDATSFEASYKGCRIYVSSNHGFGKPKYSHLTRYNISVKGKDGGYLVDTYDDFHSMLDAIRYALCGACLIN